MAAFKPFYGMEKPDVDSELANHRFFMVDVARPSKPIAAEEVPSYDTEEVEEIIENIDDIVK